ncbi:uncharacterized protein LOC120110165 [Phoenix dactylifera]|uniref:Uncharacterized protein LOC120110165 n=1 Tax=Phoenix dactylifera TaxID=42345 RepID=A0A8B9A104_PHODC|nr:uncharacterized protein LOC120110165 [Phoenix dactylifera]
MLSNGNEYTKEILRELELGTNSDATELIESIRVSIPSVNQTELSYPKNHKRRFLDFLRADLSRDWFKKLGFSSPLTILQRTVDEREEISLSVSSPVGTQQHFHINFIRKINWASLVDICKEWIKHPMNAALLIWLVCVAISASMLGLLLLGLLDKAFPTKSSRNHWIEINNQVLNALFTLMSLYQHPNLFHHFVLLCRWRSEDIIRLRKTYCKSGAYRPHEWAHMMVVLVLLHITCFSQYALCGLYWGYTRTRRPEFAENFFVVLGTATTIIAGAYTVYSPLGREYNSDSDEESPRRNSSADVKHYNMVGLALNDRRVVVSEPEWAGGLFDCGDDITVSCLSLFCTFCVFGWNMERLGFGNMYVHIVTFLLLCAAPFWIFNISALKIHDQVIGDMVGTAGIVLCAFGLVYGGFWRIQMRKRFKLPGNTPCLGSPSLTDYAQWMFCWACSLAQEVRTGNLYDVEDGSLYRKQLEGDEESSPFLTPLPRERGLSTKFGTDGASQFPISYPAKLPNSTGVGEEHGIQIDQLHVMQVESSILASDDALRPPVRPLIPSLKKVGDGNSAAPPHFPHLQARDDSSASIQNG